MDLRKVRFLLFGHVPIELPLMFLCRGPLAGVHFLLVHSPRSPSLRLAQGFVLALGVAVYAWWISTGADITMLVVTVPLGFWGYEQLLEATPQFGTPPGRGHRPPRLLPGSLDRRRRQLWLHQRLHPRNAAHLRHVDSDALGPFGAPETGW